MIIRRDFPHAVREIENTWIPMPDGARLAARIWLPQDAESRPVPALLEYIPYRKDDHTLIRDAAAHAYFAGHGYASIRVDMRGSGSSDGVLTDEFLPQEFEDGLAVLKWIAAQPWCTGAVGMFGISWGGFNGLQIAARRPPELKAVISVCSSDDRYADDLQHMGGCLLAASKLSWASTMLAYCARPPQPRVVGERWRDMWLQRLEQTPPYLQNWLNHQRRDAYWKHGSICENYADITCPVYLVGGWADGYCNTVQRMLERLSCPRKGLIGPWGHVYPHLGLPEPAIGFLQECLRWWDYWLKGVDTGIMEEPQFRAWMQASVPPRESHPERPGRWVAEPAWPSPNITTQTYWLAGPGPGRLAAAPASEARLELVGSLAHGLDTGNWLSFGAPGDFAGDQRGADGLALCFDSAPADAPIEILGFPEVTLALSVDRPNALLAVRLCDVAPGGASLLVTHGLLNLTHREGHERLAPVEPGRRCTVTVRLNAIAHSLPAGHRWRVAVSPTYWPFAWPSPEPVTLTLFAGQASRLDLPVRRPNPADSLLAPFGPPEGAPFAATETLRPATRTKTHEHDLITGRHTLVERWDSGRWRLLANGLEYDSRHTETYSIVEGQPLSAAGRCEWRIALERGGWRTRIETFSTLTADAGQFHLTNGVDAYEGETRIFAKTWTFSVARDHV